MKRQFLLLFMTIIAFMSCQKSDKPCFRFNSISDSFWERTNNLVFDVDTISDSGLYAMVGMLRINNDFPYKEVYLLSEMSLENPQVVRIDTIRCVIGWKKNKHKKSGLTCLQIQSEAIIMHLTKGQFGKVRLKHLMQRTDVPGIKEVGLQIAPNHNSN